VDPEGAGFAVRSLALLQVALAALELLLALFLSAAAGGLRPEPSLEASRLALALLQFLVRNETTSVLCLAVVSAYFASAVSAVRVSRGSRAASAGALAMLASSALIALSFALLLAPLEPANPARFFLEGSIMLGGALPLPWFAAAALVLWAAGSSAFVLAAGLLSGSRLAVAGAVAYAIFSFAPVLVVSPLVRLGGLALLALRLRRGAKLFKSR
jgi:hypothetical protein